MKYNLKLFQIVIALAFVLTAGSSSYANLEGCKNCCADPNSKKCHAEKQTKCSAGLCKKCSPFSQEAFFEKRSRDNFKISLEIPEANNILLSGSLTNSLERPPKLS